MDDQTPIILAAGHCVTWDAHVTFHYLILQHA